MTKPQDIQLKQLEIELEELKGRRLEKMHDYKLEELKLQKEIAEVWNAKKRKKRLSKKINKLQEVKQK